MYYLIKNYKTILAVFILLCIAMVFLHHSLSNATDFKIFLSSANALLDGINPYNVMPGHKQGEDFIYPLFISLLFIPITFVTTEASIVIWYCINLFAYVITLHLSYLLCFQKKSLSTDAKLYSIIGITLFFASPLLKHFANGQINLLIICLMCAFFYCLQNNKKNMSSIFLAAATAIKIIPAILLFSLLLKKEYKYFGYTILYTGLFVILPYILIGDNIVTYYYQYISDFVGENLLHQTYIYSEVKNIVPFNISETIHAFTRIDVGIARAISFFVGIIIICYLTILHNKSNHKDRDALVFSVLCCLALLLSPKLQKPFLVILIPSCLYIISICISQKQYFTLSVKLLTGCFAFFFIFKSIHQGYFYFFAMVSLLAALMLILHNMRKAKPLTQQT
jgi:hypothetical protein